MHFLMKMYYFYFIYLFLFFFSFFSLWGNELLFVKLCSNCCLQRNVYSLNVNFFAFEG